MKDLLYTKCLLFLLLALITGCSDSGNSIATDSEPTATFELTVSIDGTGTGTVTSLPAGVNCGTDCSESFPGNTVVSLTASTANGSSFKGWSGACTGTDSCTVTMDVARSVTAAFAEYIVDCSAYTAYSPAPAPIVTLSTAGPATTTIIMMHGKTGSPLNAYLSPLYTELSAAGYDVIAPYMPWSGLEWDGSMCEAMNYIDNLAAQEAIKGHTVIVAGHSMGGAHALLYAATIPPAEVKGIFALAPAHFPQLEDSLQAAITTSIAEAEEMVANGGGDDQNTFDTLLPGITVQITASANDYLSYHALYRYPDINDVLPVIKLPVLWLAGADDPLTSYYDMPALFNSITSQHCGYEAVNGDHTTMVSNSAIPAITWLPSLGI